MKSIVSFSIILEILFTILKSNPEAKKIINRGKKSIRRRIRETYLYLLRILNLCRVHTIGRRATSHVTDSNVCFYPNCFIYTCIKLIGLSYTWLGCQITLFFSALSLSFLLFSYNEILKINNNSHSFPLFFDCE